MQKSSIKRSRTKRTLSNFSSELLTIKSPESGPDELLIPFKMPGLNDYVKAERGNRYGANHIKQSNQRDIELFIHNAVIKGTLHRHEKPCRLDLHWVEGNARRDLDNVAFATKFIQDALVVSGIFPDDSQKYIKELHHTLEVQKGIYMVTVKIEEI